MFEVLPLHVVELNFHRLPQELLGAWLRSSGAQQQIVGSNISSLSWCWDNGVELLSAGPLFIVQATAEGNDVFNLMVSLGL